jgi:hypothetical protein
MVAISGATAIVSHFERFNGDAHNLGAVFIFVRRGSAWSLEQKLTAPQDAVDSQTVREFGFSVDISGNTAIVGQIASIALHENTAAALHGAAYIYTRNGTEWSLEEQLTRGRGTYDEFGRSVALTTRSTVKCPPM